LSDDDVDPVVGHPLGLLDGVDLLHEQAAGVVHPRDEILGIAERYRDDQRPGLQRERKGLLVQRTKGVVDGKGPIGELAHARDIVPDGVG
jgi:hypothetical protein